MFPLKESKKRMIDRISAASWPGTPGADAASGQTMPGHKILRMVKNSRTAGMIPAWVKADSPLGKIEQNLAFAETNSSTTAGNAQSYRPGLETPATNESQEFGFADLLDMVNPLQHIPVVSSIYRNLTGDEIRPVGKIIGGGLFGGVIGAASGLVNMIIENETGDDVTGNAFSFLTQGKQPNLKTQTPSAVSAFAPTDLPGTLLAFTDLSHDPNIVIEKHFGQKRTFND